jgi:chemotaxis protein MotB
MMAFFMVMWIMGLSDDTRTKIQGYFNDPIGFTKNQPRFKTVIAPKSSPAGMPGQKSDTISQPLKNEQKSMKTLKSEVEKALKANPDLRKFLAHLDIKVTAEGLRIEFLEDKEDFFEVGKAELKPGALKLVKTLAPMLASTGHAMGIEGHTDSTPFAGDPYRNLLLSSDRAGALAVALGHAGVPAEKFNYVKGFADRELRDPLHPTSAVNRRVTILMPFTTPVTATTLLPKDQIFKSMGASVIPGFGVAPQKPNVLVDKK